MITANFFWHGASLSLYERACLSSFVRHGFEVRLHSFNAALVVPEGVRLCDAADLAEPAEVFKFTQGGHAGSIAAFTDIFRYRVLQRESGWWFDTDVFCLVGAEAFARLQENTSGILVGEEEPGRLNGAVLYVADTRLAHELEERADAHGTEFEWGAIGPQLITAYLRDCPRNVRVVDAAHFYPVHYLETAMLFQPEHREACRERSSGSVCIHLWNEFLRRWDIPKNVLPCADSFLHELFVAQGVTVAPDTSLPEASFEALRHNGEIGRVGNQALRLIRRAKRLKEAVAGR